MNNGNYFRERNNIKQLELVTQNIIKERAIACDLNMPIRQKQALIECLEQAISYAQVSGELLTKDMQQRIEEDIPREDTRDTNDWLTGLTEQIQETMASLNPGDYATIVVRKDSAETTEDFNQ